MRLVRLTSDLVSNMSNRQSATLLMSCPDKKGLVAAIANFLMTYNANILHADQHQDEVENLFLMRVEWDLDGFTLPMESFSAAFQPIADEHQMSWHVSLSSRKPRMAIFVSKYEHCLVDLLHRWRIGELACDIPLVISNHGGRVLDGAVSPMEVIAEIRTALPHTPLLLDSGVRQGTDILKALALGANAVMLGRPQLHALAVAGMLGVAHMLYSLRAELELAMAQTGCSRLADIDPTLIRQR